MDCLTFIAEQKIAKAIQDGELKTSGWENRPLPLEDDHMVPDDLKMAYKILKNSGYLPPEIETRKEITRLEELIAKTEDEHQRVQQMRKLAVLRMKVEACRKTPSKIAQNDEYYRKVVERTTVHSEKKKEKGCLNQYQSGDLKSGQPALAREKPGTWLLDVLKNIF